MASSAFGIISPHPPIIVEGVGGGRAHVTQDTLDALDRCREAIALHDPTTVVLMSPHAPAVADAIAVDDASEYLGSLAQFGDPLKRRYDGDPHLASEILSALDAVGVPALARSADPRLRGGWLDHATIVPLSFVDPHARYKLVILSLSMLQPRFHRLLGEAVRAAGLATGRRLAFVASGDLSHRLTHDAGAGYSPKGAELDQAIVGAVTAGLFESLMDIPPDLSEEGGECGLRSFIALGGFLGRDPIPTRVLSYEGPWGVGYLTALAGADAVAASDRVTPQSGSKGGVAGTDESEIVELARRTIEGYVRDGVRPQAASLHHAGLPARAGAFVSLHRGGELRGCIGTIAPTRESLASEVAANAIEAATGDPRFPRLEPDELADLEVKVDVLHAPEPAELGDLDPSTYGVIVTSGWRRGLLLPDLEGVDDVATQVAIALRKGGISPDEPYSIERFKVDRYT